MSQKSRISEKWLKAAAVGSLWASIEIVLGSFLHNLRFPMAGTLLSFMSVGLMVSFLRMWPVKGLIWRAGLICALMKSISPSAVILGPMTGILLEAFLMEGFIRLAGINLTGMILGGMAGVFSALVHKVINLLILYGWNLASLFDNLVRFASKQIGFEDVGAARLLLLLSLFYLVAGALAALMGWKIAGGISPVTAPVSAPAAGKPLSRLFQYTDPRRFSVLLLVIHLAALTGILLAMNRMPAWSWLSLSLIYLGFTLWRYRRGLRQLMRPRLWIQLLLITLLASIFLQGIGSGNLFAWEGVKAGLIMNLRAMLLLTGFSAIGTELRNPVIKAILYRRGFASLYQSLGLAFSILPQLLEEIGTPHKHNIRSGAMIRKVLERADSVYRQILEIDRSLPPVFLIVGHREEGKTRFLKEVVERLETGDWRLESGADIDKVEVGGFCSEGVHNEAGERTGYRIRECGGSEAILFCKSGEEDGSERVGKYNINPEGLKAGLMWLSPERVKNSGVVIIDEMGPLELSGRGWAPAIERLLSECPKPMIWTVRRSLAEKMARKWTVGPVMVWDVSKTTPEQAIRDLLAVLTEPRPDNENCTKGVDFF